MAATTETEFLEPLAPRGHRHLRRVGDVGAVIQHERLELRAPRGQRHHRRVGDVVVQDARLSDVRCLQPEVSATTAASVIFSQ